MKFLINQIHLQYNEQGDPQLVLTTQSKPDITQLKEILSSGKLIECELKQQRKARSLDANACLWAILTQIGNVIRSSKDEVYLTMLERYGVFTHVIVKPEAVERIKQEWRTVRELGEVTVNGKTGVQLQCYYGSHTYDTKEFSILLDGVISEAKELGISVISESERNLLLNDWGKKNE